MGRVYVMAENCFSRFFDMLRKHVSPRGYMILPKKDIPTDSFARFVKY